MFSLQIVTIHWCTTLAYDVLCIVGNYLHACVKASAMVSLMDWTGLQVDEDVGYAITATNADMDGLDGRNAQADQIVWSARVLLWVIVGPLTT